MFKTVLILAFCIIVIAECKPTENNESPNMEHRVARSAQFAQNAMKYGGELANQGIGAATKGVDIASAAMQQAISAGTSIAADAAKNVGTMF